MELEELTGVQFSMKALIALSMLTFLSVASAATPARAADSAAPQPAAWLQHNLIVSLHDLPRTYSCDDLWYKFRDVLLEIGARADYKILPYDCDSTSPQLQLNFALPQGLGPSQQQYADLDATSKTVELEPGKPSTLNSSDCQLAKQMNASLFPAIPLKVDGSQFECTANGKSHFELTVAALTPVKEPNSALAAETRAKSPLASHH
jgi:hypothetical protein